jgi:uncharacterized protein (DUF697 family)
MRDRYPDESPAQLARRHVAAQLPLSLIGGAVMHLPMLFPTIGPVLKALGIAAGTSAMVQLNMVLLLEIAHIFGHDIDDRARLKEMAVIIAASGAASGTSLSPYVLNLAPRSRVFIGGATVVTVSHLIGEAAIRYYSRAAEADDEFSRAGEVVA